MPLYDYKCNSCDELFEKQVKLANSDDVQECPHCGGMDTCKQISRPPGFGDPFRMGFTRPDNGFKEVLQKIHEKTPGSILKDNCRYL